MENDPNVLQVVAHETIETGELPPGTPAASTAEARAKSQLKEVKNPDGSSYLTSDDVKNFTAPLKVKADETINTKDVPPGTPLSQTLREQEESLPKEEVEKRQKVMLEYTRLSSRYCAPHNKKSRWVTADDLEKVLADGRDLVAMCNLPRGKYSGIAALAHPQIDATDPLRFFVFPNGMVVINPVITSHTRTPVKKNEGCMSYPDEPIKQGVERYNKITVTYQTLTKRDKDDNPSLSDPVTETLNGGQSHVFQHECGHLNGSNIYDADYSPEKAIYLGDGVPVDPGLWGPVAEVPVNTQ